MRAGIKYGFVDGVLVGIEASKFSTERIFFVPSSAGNTTGGGGAETFGVSTMLVSGLGFGVVVLSHLEPAALELLPLYVGR